MKRRFTRRSVLRGAAGIAVGLPFLDIMLGKDTAQAQAMAAPQRFGVFFSANGVINPDWIPTGGVTDFVLSKALAPLTPYRSDIVVVHGLNAETSYMQDGNPHDLGMAHMLTAKKMLGSTFGRAGHILDGTAGGPSVDQAIAKVIGNDTKHRSLELGVQSTITDLEPMVTRMSYGGPYDPRTPIDDPKVVFASLFGEAQAGQAAIATLHDQRRSVLDAVLQDFNGVSATLGYEDKQKLTRHADAIRDLERQLDLMPSTVSCTIPTAAPNVMVDVYDCTRDGRPTKCLTGFPEIGKAQMDLLVLALACDLTRVASLQWSTAESTTVHSQIPVTNEHHLMSHDPLQAPDMTKVNTWYATQFAYLLGELKKVPEGDGTLLDHMLLFWPNELSQADVHNRRNLPYVVAGKCNGKLQTGRFLHYDNTAHNQLLASFMNMFGIPTTGFGEPEFPGTLSGFA
ncbi:MAG TPA: DUF1552 domain-containing protein [Polyangiaceae bacterium]|jgi:hypothetical protein